ncbi:MAG: ABC transporter permease, partial [Betaproteobacteria bacterium]
MNFPFKPVILTTDALIFLLLAVVAVSAWYISRHEHLLAPWKKVGHSRSGMIAAVVLLVFVIVGLLDSVHFRPRLAGDTTAGSANYAVDVMSLFDVIAAPLRSKPEKTYSAPMSAYLFAKETVPMPDGTEVRLFPRLKHGGAHLKDPALERESDIIKRSIAGLAIAALAWNVLLLCVTFWLAHRHARSVRETWSDIWRGRTAVPWREMLITGG